MSDEPQGGYGFDYRRAKKGGAAGPAASARPLADVSRQAVEVLVRELGMADTLRFLAQFSSALGDYTAERDALIDKAKLEEVIAKIRSSAKAGSEADGPGVRKEGRSS